MNPSILTPEGACLASRHSAASLRLQAEAIIASGHRITIDLTHVHTIASAYADELFGILAKDLGLTGFLWSVSIRGASPRVMQRVAESVKERLQSHDLQDQLQSLVAARKRTRQPACSV